MSVGHGRESCKTAEPIEMPFVMWTLRAPKNYALGKKVARTRLPVLGSQPAGNVSHKPGGMLPSLSARPAVTVYPPSP